MVWTTADLGAATARIERDHGLVAAGGGTHAGHGTHNRIVPLGGGFLEVLAIEDADVAAGSPIGRGVALAGEGLYGWVVAVPDVTAHVRRLGLSELTLRRGDIAMRIAGVAEAMASPGFPFFIERADDMPVPGAESAEGGIASLRVGCAPDELARWLDGAELPIECVPAGRPGVLSVTLGSGKTITSPA
ncbi:MAG TPA: VOC family protein [Solirubrobacteraceae bacterium]|nr:VOC family protein [Solirubrobacteraceae bacterium]